LLTASHKNSHRRNQARYDDHGQNDKTAI